MRSKYGLKDVAANRVEYDQRYYKANRKRILRRHKSRYAASKPGPHRKHLGIYVNDLERELQAVFTA